MNRIWIINLIYAIDASCSGSITNITAAQGHVTNGDTPPGPADGAEVEDQGQADRRGSSARCGARKLPVRQTHRSPRVQMCLRPAVLVTFTQRSGKKINPD